MPEDDAVLIAEPVAKIIAHPAELRAAGGRLKFAGIGLHSKITAADLDFFAALNAFNNIVTDAAGAVDPAIEAPGEAIHLPLLIFRAKAGEEDFFHVRPAVAIRIFGIENVRRSAHKSPPLPG